MAATQLSARMTLGSIFATVGNAAGAVSSVLDSTSKAVSLLEGYVDDALADQRERMVGNSISREQRIAEELGQEMTARQVNILKFRDQSPDHAELYDANYKKVLEAIRAAKAKQPAISA